MHDTYGVFMHIQFLIRALVAITVFASAPPAYGGDIAPRILMMGDSLFAFQSANDAGIANTLRTALGSEVTDRSVSGARMIYKLPISGALGMNISKQFREGDWDWIVLSGGGNDLWLGCGCHKCERRMNRLISQRGDRGEIPKLIARLQETGAKIVYVGYLRSPGVNSPIESCKDEGEVLEARISQLAALNDNLYFLPLDTLVPYGDRSFHALDMIHTSRKGSAVIGGRIVDVITENQ